MKYALLIAIILICFMIGFSLFFYPNNSQALIQPTPTSEVVMPPNPIRDLNTPLSIQSLSNDIDIKAAVPEKYNPDEAFFDDFNSSELNPVFWNKMDRIRNYNNELQAYVPSQVFLENGNLVLMADSIDRDYISGLVDTQSKIEILYGTIEVRLKYPEGKSFFPAVWLLPTNDLSFPEIDILEVIGHHPEKAYFVYHYMQNGVKKKSYDTATVENYSDYHTYKLEWTKDSLVWYLDDIETHRATTMVPDQPMYLILNFAIGGIWPGDPDENTVFPSQVLIDYVKISPLIKDTSEGDLNK